MALAAAFKSTFRRPQNREENGISINERVWRSSLALVETFQDLPIAQLAALETHLVTVPVCRGEVLVRAGDEADALYRVVSVAFPWRRADAAWPKCRAGRSAKSPSSPTESGRPR